jgi:hypothetical protein
MIFLSSSFLTAYHIIISRLVVTHVDSEHAGDIFVYQRELLYARCQRPGDMGR